MVETVFSVVVAAFTGTVVAAYMVLRAVRKGVERAADTYDRSGSSADRPGNLDRSGRLNRPHPKNEAEACLQDIERVVRSASGWTDIEVGVMKEIKGYWSS